ncbi:hypothetical protein QDR07_05110 [Clostridium perfringens]|uniref:Uncharacterized protein n=1 Tax=Clostridium perfringens B str. ATCC 3626 TaxID=451754 RepID=A0AAV3BSP1_CLOPF|nr:hypothetical protein [Clostridium perfringens]EDT24796.1 hypothetical protein AC1_0994 [Clostridium perfringens B str. ATCC 3626]MDH2457898.1 hypothetical protein [Clostridium perfringens]MDT7999398.1 hypothetical protein [Clostridium perfringens]MDU4070633.1 hypothetical protein [Clostridium perfringens]
MVKLSLNLPRYKLNLNNAKQGVKALHMEGRVINKGETNLPS